MDFRSANYDVDLGNLFLQDWDHSTADELYINAQTQGAISALTGLINGTNVYGEDSATDQTGQRFETTFETGTSYLLRLVNVAIDTHFKFTIDNHTMTVIASDFVPVTPYETTEVSIGMGQRYDVIVTADQADTASDFWMRAVPMIACSDNDNPDNIKGIIHYGTSTGTPTTSAYSITDECVDESSLVPVVSKTVGSSTMDVNEAVGVGFNDANYFIW
jgi:FtsP/CotA-like multicopper oxidase with cupredoxin domain